ncbi:MAG: SAP domain-containing protein [Oscillospiraceae bacterium]|nr:SAP domain-containing protein [Oscillospiraceae bacterium]
MAIFPWSRKKNAELLEDTSVSLEDAISPDQAELDALFDPPKPAYEAGDKSLTASGLYPHEVLILAEASALFIDQEEFPPFWRRDYGIWQMQKILASLVERGFLEEASIALTLEAATVPALKQALRSVGKPVGGKKAELVARLLEEVPAFELYALFPNRTFTLTPAGIQALDEAMHIPYLHKRPVEGLSIWSLHSEVVAHPEQSYRDLIWDHLHTRSGMHTDSKNYAAYRACRYRMYQFLIEENKLKRAFPYLAEVIFYDLSGVDGNADTLTRYVSEKYFFPYDKSIVKLSATCVNAMRRLKEDLNLTEEMMRALLIQFFGQLSIPDHLFTIEECAVIVLLELRGDTERLRQVYEMAETRFGQRR